jgi:hypothetical protein
MLDLKTSEMKTMHILKYLLQQVLNDSVRGSLSVEFFATMCGNILKDSRTGSLCNEARKVSNESHSRL